MYGNPKMYMLKSDEVEKVVPPLRPINSSIGAYNYNLAKYLCELLHPAIPSDYCVTDSFTFVQDLKKMKLKDKYLVSFDVENLFTNIPLKETVDLAVDLVFEHHSNIKMSKIQMRKLFVFATSHTHFIYNGQYYDQINGVQMGSPLGPLLANLFMGHHEKSWIDSYSGPKPLHYCRYVDDIFCIFESEDHVAPFLNYLNDQHADIKFTVEKEVDGKLPFLDILISKYDILCLHTTVYRKSTYTGLLTNFTSFISIGYKIGLIKTLVDRACKINSTIETLRKDTKFIQEILQKNMYPQHIIRKFISSDLRTHEPSTTKISTDSMRYFKLPYIGNFSTLVKSKVQKIIKKYCKSTTSVQLIFTSKKISSYFSLKDNLPSHIIPYVVYKYECANCKICYIGETTKQFIVRINEHLHTDKNSAIYKHLKNDSDCNSLCGIESFKIIDRAPTEYQLRIKEAFYIQKFHPSLNKQSESINVALEF